MTQEDLTEETSLWADDYDAESDLELKKGYQAVVTGTDWTVETILSQMRRGNFDLSPKFQRRDAWDASRKSRFIESLILQLPVPQIVLAEKKHAKGQYIVLDGKQRLLALQQFAADSSLDPHETDFNKLKLTKLDMRPDLLGLTLADLEESPEHIDDLNSFLNQTIRTVVVRSWPNDDFLNLVFLRLNTGSVGLSPQELRQALAPGPFTDFLDNYASSSAYIRKALKLQRPDFRMRDVEIALRFLAFDFRLSSYQGNLKKFLDETTDYLNRLWEDHKDEIVASTEALDASIECTMQIFGDKAFRRWTVDGYHNSFNRAIFDVMTFYFSDESVRAAALAKASPVKSAFERLILTDADFVDAIQTTTKSVAATRTRLFTWGKALASVLNIDLPRMRELEALETKQAR